jgi:hypothetical protein
MSLTCGYTSALGRIRTCDSRFRKPLLYPLSYEGGANIPASGRGHRQGGQTITAYASLKVGPVPDLTSGMGARTTVRTLGTRICVCSRPRWVS